MNHDKLSFPGLGIELDIDPIAVKIGSFEVYWYGIIIAAAMLTCFLLAVKQAKKNNFSPDLVYDLMFITLPCAIVGARIYYVIFKWDYYSKDLSKIFDTRSGGLAIYGGVIAVLLGYFIMCRIRKIPYSTVIDYLAPLLPLGQAIGRWGNFFNREAFGKYTDAVTAMQLPVDTVRAEEITDVMLEHAAVLDGTTFIQVHPTFLYESLWNFLLLGIMLFLILSGRKKRHGDVFLLYLAGYGLGRFWIEGLRTDQLLLPGTALAVSQVLSLLLIVLAVILYIIRGRIYGGTLKKG